MRRIFAIGKISEYSLCNCHSKLRKYRRPLMEGASCRSPEVNMHNCKRLLSAVSNRWCRQAFAFTKNARSANQIVYIFSRNLTQSFNPSCPAQAHHVSDIQMALTEVPIMKQVSRGGCEGEGNLACLDRVKTVLQMASQKVVSFVVS